MRILISGAGIAGSTLAWFLSKTGAQVTVVERSAAIQPFGQNVDLQGNARVIIEKMGLTAEVRRFNTTEQGTQFIDPEGQPFARFPVKKGSSASFTSEFEILRSDLAALLHEAAKTQPNVEYRFDTTIARIVSNDAEQVVVELSTGEIARFDLLVAADGQWSKVRKLCFPADSVEVVDKGMYAVYWTTPRIPSDNDWWNVYQALDARTVMLRPDPHGTIRASFSCMPSTDDAKRAWAEAARGDRELRAALLRRAFADVAWEAPRLLAAMDEAPDFYFQAVQQIKMAKWSIGRVVCVGDAAWAPTPLTGMGTSLAIDGAYILAGELSRVGSGEDLTGALEAYERAFRAFVEKTQAIPFFVPAIAHPRVAWQRRAFNLAVTAAARIATIPWLSKRLGTSGEPDFKLPDYPRLAV